MVFLVFVQHSAVHAQLLGLTILEELHSHLRERGVAEHVLLLLVIVADFLPILFQFGRDVVGGPMGNDLIVANAFFADFLVHLGGQTAIFAAQATPWIPWAPLL